MKDLDRSRIDDLRLRRDLADFDKIRRETERFERIRRASLDHGGMNTALDNVGKFGREMADLAHNSRSHNVLYDAERRIAELERARDRVDQAAKFERNIARLQGMDRRIQDFENVQKRIADFERTSFKINQFDEIQRRLTEQQKLMERAKSATDFAFTPAAFSGFGRYGYDLASAVPMRYLNTIQERATAAFALSDRDAERIRTRTEEIYKAGWQRNFIRNAVETRDMFAAFEQSRQSFLSELTASVRTAVVDSRSDEEAVEKIATLVTEKLNTLPKSRFSNELIAALVIGVLQLVLAMYQIGLARDQAADAQKSAAEQNLVAEKIIAALEKIVKNTEVSDDDEIYYLVERTVAVKARPNFKSRTIDQIPTNTKVRVLKTNHKWLLVEYLDSLDLEPRLGWVSKKYLKRIS